MLHVTSEIYSKLASEVERLVEWAEGGFNYDYADPDSIKETAEVESGELFITVDFTAYPSYRYEEINPGLYGPDGQWGYTRQSVDVDFGSFSATNEDGDELENDFSADELKKYLDF